MFKKITIAIILFVIIIFTKSVYSQSSAILPESHRIDWSNAGVQGGIPDYPVQHSVLDFGAVGDGITDNTTAFNQAISATSPGNALYIPEGSYFISSGLNTIKKGIVIRGAGPDKTEITKNGNYGFLNVWGGGPVDAAILSTAAHKGSTILNVDSAKGISSGDILCVARLEDGVPQIVEVSAVNGTQIELSGPLYSDFAQGSNVSTLNNMVHGFGLEDIKLHSYNEPNMKNKVSFQFTARSWVKNIETLGTEYVEVNIHGGFHCEVRDSYFHQDYELAEHYEPGSISYTSYGVELGGVSTDNLVENNIFLFFRHAMVMNGDYVGGNVYGYNYSQVMLENNSEGVLDRNFGIGDFEVHHRKVEMTLSEGNNFELARIMGSDGDWRKTHNTFLRNRTTQSGIAGSSIGAEDNYLIGNEAAEQRIDNPDRPNTIGCSGCIDHGNYEVYNNAGISWDPGISDHNIPDSYYLSEKPDWFGDLDWPPYGGDLMEQSNGNNTRRSPAEVRLWSTKFPEISPSGLSAETAGNENILNWTNNSTNEVDFIICRSVDGLNYERIATVSDTTFTDTIFLDGQYFYYVRARNYLGGEYGSGGESDPSETIIVSSTVSVENDKEIPVIFSLSQNYPNPFNPVTTIKYSIPNIGARSIVPVRLYLYNLLGQEVAKLVNEQQPAGNYEVKFDGSSLASGVYLYKLTAGEFVSVKRFVLMK